VWSGIASSPFYVAYVAPYVALYAFVGGIVFSYLWIHTWTSKIKPSLMFWKQTPQKQTYQDAPVAQSPQVIPKAKTSEPVLVVEKEEKKVEQPAS
jgi:hypothetical protein